MNIGVIGLGSMGKRRIRLLKKGYIDISVCGIDLNESRKKQSKDEFKIEVYSDIKEAVEKQKLDAMFVCTSPNTHADIILTCLDYKLNVFTEINLISNKYSEIIDKAKKNNCKLFLSSTPLYRKEMEYITKKTQNFKKPLNYIYHIGQYLPDWHPWENYRNFFVGNKETNGCREIFAIELPWLINAFGNVISISAEKSKNTDLDIQYNDNYIVTINHTKGNKGVLVVDVVSRKAVRLFETFGEDLYISWQGTSNSLKEYDSINKRENNVNLYEKLEKNEEYAEFVIENDYMDEIKDFINYLDDKNIPKYSFEKDMKILNLIDKIEE